MANPVQYDHLQFYKNSANASATVPALNFGPPSLVSQNDTIAESLQEKTGTRDAVKVVEIIEYIKQFSGETKVSIVDILREFGIDLSRDRVVLEMLKSNPKLESGKDNDGSIFFRFRAKLIIRNKMELKQTLTRSDVGVLMSDIEDCYPGIRADIMDMVRGGEIIGVENKEKKTLVLFTRGPQYFSALSGTVVANPGEQNITTSEDLTKEIRRGEAVLVGQFWYRVSSAVKVGAGQDQPQRARAPASVTLDKELSDRNEYILPFNKDSLPLDGDFEDQESFNGKILKHGATNDIRKLWGETAEDIESFRNDELALIDELYQQKHILYSRSNLVTARTGRGTGQGRGRGRGGGGGRISKKFMATSGSNAHLQGSGIAKIAREVEQEQLARMRK